VSGARHQSTPLDLEKRALAAYGSWDRLPQQQRCSKPKERFDTGTGLATRGIAVGDALREEMMHYGETSPAS
jgi:hypothetical protein